MADETQEKCKQCEWWEARRNGSGSKEISKFLVLEYDVDLAREIAKTKTDYAIMSESSIRSTFSWCHYNKAHVEHIPDEVLESEPGIVAWLFAPSEGKNKKKLNYDAVTSGQFLMDGRHRAAAHLARGKPFRIVILTLEESLKCLKPGFFFPNPEKVKAQLSVEDFAKAGAGK